MRLVTEVWVPGLPVTKGSWDGKGRPAHEAALCKWEDAVRKAVVADMDERDQHVRMTWQPAQKNEAVHITTRYYVHGGQTGHLWKPGDGDGDKLDRAVWDALTAAGAWLDDVQVTDWEGGRRYAHERTPGVYLCVTAMNLSDWKALEALRGQAFRRVYDSTMYGGAP